jgi:arylsulfatase
MTGWMENVFVNVKSVPHTITAEVILDDAATEGVILAQAGYFGGWTLYMKGGKVHHEYNFFGVERTNIGGSTALTPGEHTITYEFIPDAAKIDPQRRRAEGRGGTDPEDAALHILRRRRRGRGCGR